jgi:ATP-dependent helicase/DNAse subunit B
MTLKLICGPTGSGKTTRAIEVFLTALDRGEKAVFIAPSGPDARHFEREILRRRGDQESNGVLTGGKVTRFGSFCQELLTTVEPDATIISPNERFLIIRTIVDTATNLQALGASSTFDGFISALGDLIAEFEMLGIDSTEMAKALRSWASGSKWRQDLNKDLYRLYEKYEAVLKDKGAYDTELSERRALEILQDGIGNPGYETVVIDGFWDFTPVQHDLLKALSATDVNVLVTLPHETGRVAYEAPVFHLKQLEKISGPAEDTADPDAISDRVPELEHLVRNLFSEKSTRVDAKGAVQLLLAAGSRGQAELVASEILKLWRSGHDLNRIAIVCRSLGPDMSTIATVLEEFGVPYELPAPVPLSNTPVGKTALSALSFVTGGKSRASLLSYLRSPLLDVSLEKVDLFDRLIRMKGQEDPLELLLEWKMIGRPLGEFDQLEKASSAGLGQLGAELCRLIRELLTGSDYIAEVSAENLRLDLLALESLEAVCGESETAQKIIEDMECGQTGETSHRSPGELLISGIRQASVRIPAATLRNCVRLLDPHRILNQRFDTVFVCGLLERQFPSFGREDSFFPDADRQELATTCNVPLDSRDRLLAEERFLFFRTLTRASKRVYLCYPDCDKEGKPNIRSLFVDDTLELFQNETIVDGRRRIGEVTFSTDEAPTMDQALRSLAILNDADGKQNRQRLLAAAEVAGLGERLKFCLDEAPPREPVIHDDGITEILGQQDSFKVTELQQYLRCPFVYFVETILAPADMEPAARGLQRGQIIHKILCRFNGQLSRAKLYLHRAKPRQIAELRRQMIGYIEEEFTDTGSDLDSLILKTELKYHLDRYITREIECARPLEYFDVEVGFGGKPGPCGGKNSTENELIIDDFRLRGRLDRVDWLGTSNRGIVIDYKSSKNVTAQEKFDEKREIQIPLYMLALKEAFGMEVIGGEYYALRGDARGGLYLKGYEEELGAGSGQVSEKDFVDEETFAIRLEAARDWARQAVSGIRQGSFPCEPRDDKDVCRYCDYEGICRRKEIPERSGTAEDD